MPFLRRPGKGNLSQSQTTFKSPYLKHTDKIIEIIGHKPDNGNLCIDGKKFSASKIGNPYKNDENLPLKPKLHSRKNEKEALNRNREVTTTNLFTEKSLSQEVLNQAEVKEKYKKFVGKLSKENEKTTNDFDRYTSSEDLCKDSFGDISDINSSGSIFNTSNIKENPVTLRKSENGKQNVCSKHLSFDTDDSLSQKELNKNSVKNKFKKFIQDTLKYEESLSSSEKEILEIVEQFSQSSMSGKVEAFGDQTMLKKKNRNRKRSRSAPGHKNGLCKEEESTEKLASKKQKKNRKQNNALPQKESRKNSGKHKETSEKKLIEEIIDRLSQSSLDTDEDSNIKEPVKKKKLPKTNEKGAKKPSKSQSIKNQPVTNELEATDDELSSLTPEERMEKLYEMRNVGLYVLCDSCNKARYLKDVVDPLDLPTKWYCFMNPDEKHNKCLDPEHVEEDQEFLLENEYNAGSIVFAKMNSFPWWPAMVEDDPDINQYYWLDENSDSMKPVSYNVTFFDSSPVTRQWIDASKLTAFKKNQHLRKFQLPKKHKFSHRMGVALKQANHAAELPLIDRLRTYGFLKRYNNGKQSRKDINNNKGARCKSASSNRSKSTSSSVSDILGDINLNDLRFDFF